MTLFFIGLSGFVVCLIVLLIKVVRKKPKKTFGILTALFLVIGLVGMVQAMNTPAIDPTQMIGEDPRPTAIDADFVKINGGEWEGKFVKLVGEVSLITKKTDDDIVFGLTTQIDDGYGIYIIEGVSWIGEVDFDIEEGDIVNVYGRVMEPDSNTRIPIIEASIVEK